MAIVKCINTLIEKKEKSGHVVIAECCKVLGTENLISNKKQVSTNDLYLMNAKCRTFIDGLVKLANAERNKKDLKADAKDIKDLKKALTEASTMTTTIVKVYDAKYRSLATTEEQTEIDLLTVELSVVKEAVAKATAKRDDIKSAYKVELMKQYGLM